MQKNAGGKHFRFNPTALRASNGNCGLRSSVKTTLLQMDHIVMIVWAYKTISAKLSPDEREREASDDWIMTWILQLYNITTQYLPPPLGPGDVWTWCWPRCTRPARRWSPPSRSPARCPPPGRSRRCSRPPPPSRHSRGQHQASWGLPPTYHTLLVTSCNFISN